MTREDALTIRLAQAADIPIIALLLAQLYHAELPGSLRGPRAGQVAVLRYTLEHSGAALFRRYVAATAERGVVGLASLRLGHDRVLSTTPPGTTRQAIQQLGLLNTLRLQATVVRASLLPEPALGRYSALLYSVVVDEHMRGQGVGGWLLDQVEQIAAAAGARSIQLRVVDGNDAAKRLYLRHGYRVISQTPALLHWATIPSELLKKTLVPPA